MIMRRAGVLLIFAFAVLVFIGIVVLQSMLILQRVAAVRQVHGEVALQPRDGDRFEMLAGRDRIFAGDTVRTGADGQLTLEWLDGTRLVVGPETVLTILKCQVNKSSDAETSILRLETGDIWVRIMKVLSQKSKFEVNTPTATAGVRGTIFSVHVAPDGQTEVAVLEGEVTVTSGDEPQPVSASTVASVGQQGNTMTRHFTSEDTLSWRQRQDVVEPVLHLNVPEEGLQTTAGQAVTISGQSEPGARVLVDGRPVELGFKHRFSADVAVPATQAGGEMTVVVEAVDARGYQARRELKVQVVQ